MLLARDPKLAVAPIDVVVSIHDLYATVDQIKQTRKQAEGIWRTGRCSRPACCSGA